ncbi:MAG: Hsp70 family protein [Acidobacteriia bacterium]|nr:Hsp70 family protein [Terriglobia bacterium]
MKLGVDFGTTRIVIAEVDRGNYPVITFDGPAGEACDWFPALVAVRGGQLLFGWDAWEAQEMPGAVVARSIKRYLPEAGPQTRVEIGGQIVSMLDLLSELCSALKSALLHRSSLKVKPSDAIEIMLGVPANANGNQRFLTVEAFRQAGFAVLGLLNEPTAASIEYGHGQRGKTDTAGKSRVLVYDLGGGTFDASLVEMEAHGHEVVASEGITSLGGDDFDGVLADLALETSEIPRHEQESMTQAELFRLHEECRRKKETLHANTRRIHIELDQVRETWEQVTVPVNEFYERARPLVAETIHAVEDLLALHPEPCDALYVTGGASELPLVARTLKESFGRRVRRSAYARSATAIGLAIQADAETGYVLREKFTRYFGVWREADSGHSVVFDPLFLKGTELPASGQPALTVRRSYHPAHNIGHFRYLECSHLTAGGRPCGEITIWDQILFPFDAALQAREDLSGAAVQRLEWGSRDKMEECYRCDSSGAVTVTISNLSGGYERDYRLGRWTKTGPAVAPGKPRARRVSATETK